MFHENWYPQEQLESICELLNDVLRGEGLIVEFGCWEGKSTISLINKSYPENVICVDTWKGNTSESKLSGEPHVTEQILEHRDVYQQFLDNVKNETKQNYVILQKTAEEWLEKNKKPIKFCHIDVSNDYWTVSEIIKKVKPLMTEGGIICGNNYLISNASRTDLGGGVENASRHNLISVRNKKNLWYWRNEKSAEKLLHPITFSMPSSKIYGSGLRLSKTRVLANIIPGKLETYIYDDEQLYYDGYKEAYFAITTKKGGWDCMRHYEIIANGCLPYFIGIEQCPPHTMKLFPKDLTLKSNELYLRGFENRDINELTTEHVNEYYNLLSEFLVYMHTHLTTHQMAKYMLKSVSDENNTPIKSVLYLNGNLEPDYLRCLNLHGFKMLFGQDCHDYPKIPHLYKNNIINLKNIYGKGMTYSNLLEDSERDDSRDETLLEDIRLHRYDIVVYGSFHRGTPLYELVREHYRMDEIVFVCGEDIHGCNFNCLDVGHHMFVREL